MSINIKYLDPIGSRESFVAVADMEIKFFEVWPDYFMNQRDNFLRGYINQNLKYPCLFGIYFWHQKAMRNNITFTSIEKEMKERSNFKINRDTALGIGKIFNHKYLQIPSEIEKIKAHVTAAKLWTYGAACFELTKPSFVSDSSNKKKGRAISQRVNMNSLSRTKTLSKRIKEYGDEFGHSFSPNEMGSLQPFLERIIRAAVHTAVCELNSPFIDDTLSIDDKLELALNEAAMKMFGTIDLEMFGEAASEAQFRAMTDVIAPLIKESAEKLARKVKKH